jgi:hypothetical protein
MNTKKQLRFRRRGTRLFLEHMLVNRWLLQQEDDLQKTH